MKIQKIECLQLRSPHASPDDCDGAVDTAVIRITAEYKRSILDQAGAAQDSGAIGALLRREGLYSSHLTTWRRQREQGEIAALTAQKRGPKVVVSPLVKKNRELLADNARLTKKLKNAALIIAVQKKVAALLGNPIPNIQIDEEN